MSRLPTLLSRTSHLPRTSILAARSTRPDFSCVRLPRQFSSALTMTESPSKKVKLDGPLIGTHSGHFHADEALAVYLLRLLPTYASSPLVRTRDPSVLATCHTVVDVGGEYDDSKNRYDHHQRTFNTTFPGRPTKLSSAGLVYMHFGRDIISQVTGLAESHPDVEILFQHLYNNFIEAFDANDNGISNYDSAALKGAGFEKRFEDRGFSIASVVNRYNYGLPPSGLSKQPELIDSSNKTREEKDEEQDMKFAAASHFAGSQFHLELVDKFRSWLPARALVRSAYASRLSVHSSGLILELPHRDEGVPWADHLYTLEREVKEKNVAEEPYSEILYVIVPESGEPDSKWRIRAVSVESGGFKNRKDLPDAWKGLRDEELSQVSGIPGCVFVHAGGFIGGNATREGALAMAAKAVE